MRTLVATALAAALIAPRVAAQHWSMPPDDGRCPSKWGADDQRGAANLLTPANVARAAQLVKTGEIVELGAVLSSDPKETYINAGRVFNVYPKPSPPIPGARQSHEELVVSELGQIGTQLDGFAHQMWGTRFYNCFDLADIGTRTGFTKLGIEHVGSIFTRGVLIDVAALKRVAELPASYVVSPRGPAAGARGRGHHAPAGGRRPRPHRLVHHRGSGQRAVTAASARGWASPQDSGLPRSSRCWWAPTRAASRYGRRSLRTACRFTR